MVVHQRRRSQNAGFFPAFYDVLFSVLIYFANSYQAPQTLGLFYPKKQTSAVKLEYTGRVMKEKYNELRVSMLSSRKARGSLLFFYEWY